MKLYGIDLNQPIIYHHSSMRYFEEGEYHITRHCKTDVLLLVFQGVLRFSEDGEEYEVSAGNYHIQRAGSYQTASKSSDIPQYLYVHFSGHWDDNQFCLKKSGSFNQHSLFTVMEALDMSLGKEVTMTENYSAFYRILTELYLKPNEPSVANSIAEYITKSIHTPPSLDSLAKTFHFSKNHIINIFKKEYGITPFEYLNLQRIKKAKQLMEATSLTAEDIAFKCGFGSYSHFYKSFYAIHGISPVKWRRAKLKILNNTKEYY